jgi:hypothetical protein
MMGQKKGEVLMLLGAVLLFIGPALDFVTVDGASGTEGLTGYDAEEGSTYVLAGVVVGAMAIGLWFASGKRARTALSAIGILGAAFGTFGGYVDLTQVDEGVPAELKSAVDAGIGTWLVLVAGIIALIGAVLSFRSAPAVAEAPPPPPPAPAAGT